jgi:hypothetical protein
MLCGSTPVSVVKIEMLEKCFSTQQWVHGYFFIEINYTIKEFIFKADSINLASVEEVFICWWNYREIEISNYKSSTFILKKG